MKFKKTQDRSGVQTGEWTCRMSIRSHRSRHWMHFVIVLVLIDLKERMVYTTTTITNKWRSAIFDTATITTEYTTTWTDLLLAILHLVLPQMLSLRMIREISGAFRVKKLKKRMKLLRSFNNSMGIWIGLYSRKWFVYSFLVLSLRSEWAGALSPIYKDKLRTTI